MSNLKNIDETVRPQKCCCCLRYDKGAILIGILDILGLFLFIGVLLYVKQLIETIDLSSNFKLLILIIPILTIIIVSGVRVISFIVLLTKRQNHLRAKIFYLSRASSTIIFFGLYLTLLILMIVLYKGTIIFDLTENDASFITSDAMKWTIILLAIALVVGTLFDLYFSLAVRTFYVNLVQPIETVNEAKIETKNTKKKVNKEQVYMQGNNNTQASIVHPTNITNITQVEDSTFHHEHLPKPKQKKPKQNKKKDKVDELDDYFSKIAVGQQHFNENQEIEMMNQLKQDNPPFVRKGKKKKKKLQSRGGSNFNM